MAANQDANAYLYENVGVEPDPLAERDANAYVYENVVFGGRANLVGQALIRVTRIVPGAGGYGTEAYGEFRYGMGEVVVVEPIGAAANLGATADLTAQGGITYTIAASLTGTVAITPKAWGIFGIAASLTATASGLEGPTPPGPPSRSEVCIPPWPETVVMRALKGGAAEHRHDSAALCTDGRIIYVWRVNDSIVNQCHYPTEQHFADADNTSATAGVNILPYLGTSVTACLPTVWRHYGTGHLFLVSTHMDSGSGYIRVYRSYSGNGESSPGVPDWVLWGRVSETSTPGIYSFIKGTNERSTGEPLALASGRWCLSAPAFPERQGMYTSDDYGRNWTLRQNIGFWIVGGPYGYGQSRNVVDYNGRLYWSAYGNVEEAKGGYSDDGGTTWPAGGSRGSSFSWPGTSNSDGAFPLTADATGLYVAFSGLFYNATQLEKAVNPVTDPRSSRAVVLPGLPNNGHGILQRVGDCDYYMINGQILASAPRGWGVGQVRIA